MMPAVVVFVLLIATALVHGLMTERWGESRERRAAASRLDHFATTLGDWDGRAVEIDPNILPLDRAGSSVIRSYANRTNGSVVTLFLTYGRPGPLLFNHTPIDCYGATGYQVAYGPAKQRVTGGPGSVPSEFLVADFSQTNSPAPTHVRVYWSWTGTGTWTIPDRPRIAFARQPIVFKLYVVRQTLKAREPLESDPALPFLGLLVPELEKTLFTDPEQNEPPG
jgi:hypothetical protein